MFYNLEAKFSFYSGFRNTFLCDIDASHGQEICVIWCWDISLVPLSPCGLKLLVDDTRLAFFLFFFGGGGVNVL